MTDTDLWHARIMMAMRRGFTNNDRKRSFAWMWCATNEICGTESMHALRNGYGHELVSMGTEFHKCVCCDQPAESMLLYKRMIQFAEPPRP